MKHTIVGSRHTIVGRNNQLKYQWGSSYFTNAITKLDLQLSYYNFAEERAPECIIFSFLKLYEIFKESF